MRLDYPKGVSILLIALIYLAASFGAVMTFIRMPASIPDVIALLAADITATVIVWIFGLLYENVSVYDPYWSVFPPVAFTVWAFYKNCFTLPVILLLVAVWYWGIRLTGNWVYTFQGMAHEDWRYSRFRDKQSPFLFFLTNLFGLNMVPTLVVFAAMLPGLGLYDGTSEANLWTWLGFVLCLSSATIQLVADTQIHRFRDAHPGEYCRVGLWKGGRHPNYFGEIQMWWGVWGMYASLHGIDWCVLGPFLMTSLFLFISIPMMERRQLHRKPCYAEYRRKTRLLI